jgi:hypothetical protein
MEPIINDNESTVRKLCAEANAERNRARRNSPGHIAAMREFMQQRRAQLAKAA